jgi:GNAT superfamily N-acetyltransferase
MTGLVKYPVVMTHAIQTVSGSDIEPYIDAIAELRITVFRAWPYLYAGSADYEREYLAHFRDSPRSVFVLALDEASTAVGCATGLPLADAHEEFRTPFEAAGYDIDEVYYFGESVLDPAWRGRGIGHAFFDQREAHARRLGYSVTSFCAVMRSDDHPLRPADYRPLDGFWRKRGYAPVEGLTTTFAWQDLGDEAETDKPMQFWLRRL